MYSGLNAARGLRDIEAWKYKSNEPESPVAHARAHCCARDGRCAEIKIVLRDDVNRPSVSDDIPAIDNSRQSSERIRSATLRAISRGIKRESALRFSD
ncbi:unnamed protein product [Lasius platythorax]|uniref:Uncharacterized protein n=1 Tax=Lasius platythorax TaxID=488582 RepID=A0AAV2NTS7_9HYME